MPYQVNKWSNHCVKCVQIQSFFWSVFSSIPTEYGKILHISPYSVRMRENTEQKNSVFGYFSRSEKCEIMKGIWLLFTRWKTFHCVKSVQIRSVFGSVLSCIQSEYRKIGTRKTPYLDTFHAVFVLLIKLLLTICFNFFIVNLISLFTTKETHFFWNLISLPWNCLNKGKSIKA